MRPTLEVAEEHIHREGQVDAKGEGWGVQLASIGTISAYVAHHCGSPPNAHMNTISIIIKCR